MTSPQPASTPVPARDEDLRALFGESTPVIASMAGPAHLLEAANPAFFTAVGRDADTGIGQPIREVVPELAAQGFVALLDRVYRTGEPYTGRDARVLLGSAGQAREAFFDFTYEPRRDADGDVTGVRMIGVETTQIKHAQRLTAEHRALLEQIARQAPLSEVLDGMAKAIEELSPGVLVSVLLADADGGHLRHGAAPSLPDFYNEAIDGIATGDAVGSCGTAAYRRQRVIVSDIATDPYWEDFRDIAERAGLAACWSSPILARDGRLLGTFAMYHRTPRAPDETDLALAGVFAGTAGLAIERSLAEEARAAAEASEKAARDDLAFLLNASTALGADLDYTQTLRRLASLCVPALAPLCAVDVVDRGRTRRVAAAAATGHEQRLLAAHRPAHDADDAVARVLATGVTEAAPRAPTGAGPWRDLKVTGYVCAPLTDRGRTFGAVTLLSTGDQDFDTHAVTLVEEVARRAATAARNARQYTQRVALARDLQAGLLLPEIPELPGAEMATYYHPAGEGLDIGGDFYDVFPLDDGRWAFLLGDVCGRGAAAAATTALVRHTARAVAAYLPDPRSICHAVNRALVQPHSGHDNGFVTLVYGHFSPADGGGLSIDLVRAGHTHPLHLTRTGVRTLRTDGSVLGIMESPPLTTARFRLAPGESLLLYTDGITESRNTAGEEFGEDRLTALLTRPHEDPSAILDSVTRAVHAFTDGRESSDDQAALVLTATTRSP